MSEANDLMHLTSASSHSLRSLGHSKAALIRAPYANVMRIDMKAVGIGYLTFLCIFLLIYLPFVPGSFTSSIFQKIAPVVPYISFFISGLVVANYSRFKIRISQVILAILISLSLGLANYYGPSDFHGIKATLWVIGISLPIVFLFVIAGQGAKELIARKNANKK